ncbi:MAG: amidohydrolase family protein [Woeseiaceae bacterium]|nr:amidohydrolase family protein [Woeseiaceae bacterium]
MSTARAEHIAVVAALLLAVATARADVVVSEGTNISVDVAQDGRHVIDLLGSLWIVPATGGDAVPLYDDLGVMRRPRWSPDDAAIVFERQTPAGSDVLLLHVQSGDSETLTPEGSTGRQPEWHPGGERIVYSSAGGGGLDLWEIDLPTRLRWRLTTQPGDETEPAWSADGRHLTYVHASNGNYALMLRRFGEPDEVLLSSEEPIAAPAWRPDGSLISYLRYGDGGWSVWMTILSLPRLHRPLIGGQDFFLSPIAWHDRHDMRYTADGRIQARRFDSWTSSAVPFNARVGEPPERAAVRRQPRALPDIDAPAGRRVLRAGRLFDGIGSDYVDGHDIVIDGGRIVSIEPRREHDDAIVIDLGDATVLPGFVDGYARLPDAVTESLGPALLSLGVTTLVAEHPEAATLNGRWAGQTMPGPRVLAATDIGDLRADGALPWLATISGDLGAASKERAAVERAQRRGISVVADSWQAAVGAGATLLLGSESLPASPAGRRYADVKLASGGGELTLVSGLADATTPWVADIWSARGARFLSASPQAPERRLSARPNLREAATTLVLGSRPNGLPPGIALHAELYALARAGLSNAQALRAAGVNAAAALGLGLGVGRIAPGAAADLVVVAGDPLGDLRDALNVIGVMRNGRFYSVSGLLDRVEMAANVE